MGNLTSSSDSCSSSLNDLRYKSNLVNNHQNYGSLYIQDDKYIHSKKSKLNKFLKFISPKNDFVQKRHPEKVKNRKNKNNFITKSLIFLRPNQQTTPLQCSTPLSPKLDRNSKSTSMFVDQQDLNSKFKSRFSLKSQKSTKLNSSTDSKNDSGILSDYKSTKLNDNSLKNSTSVFSINDEKSNNDIVKCCSSNQRRLSVVTDQVNHKNSMKRTTTFHSTKSSIPQETTAKPQSKNQKIIVQASTSELLKCFTSYLFKKYPNLIRSDNEQLTCSNRLKADSRDVISWLRSADRALLIQGWQEIAFMNPVNVVFVYLLVRDSLNEPKTVYELQCQIMSCLYLAFSYMGNEISYPLKPFLVEDDRESFWTRIVSLMDLMSSSMLRINRDARFFTELFYELKSYSIQTNPLVDQSLVKQHQSLQKSITVNSFRTFKRDEQTRDCLVNRSSNFLVYSSCSKNVLKPSSYDLNKNTHGSFMYSNANSNEPIIKPIAYCI